jgi:hypothetical protein
MLVIRLKHLPTATALEALNEDYADIILNKEKIRVIEPTQDEREDDDQLDLARIAFGFNRRDYGRLRLLVDALNAL